MYQEKCINYPSKKVIFQVFFRKNMVKNGVLPEGLSGVSESMWAGISLQKFLHSMNNSVDAFWMSLDGTLQIKSGERYMAH